MLRKIFIICFLLVLHVAAQASPPQLLLEVARFRNLDKVEGGAEVEIYVTVPTQHLLYRQRAPKQFQSAATVMLQIVNAAGKSVFQETVTLKPPTLSDTTIQIKNPVSFLKRITLPDGDYVLKGRVRDLYRSANGETTVEQTLKVAAAPKLAFLSDIILLAKPAVKTNGTESFIRSGYLLTRAPGGLFARGAETVFFYTELHQATAGRALKVHYHLAAPDGTAADVDTDLKPVAGRPTVLVGQLPLGPLPDGEFNLTIEIRSADNKLLTTQIVRGRREIQDYAPAGAAAPR